MLGRYGVLGPKFVFWRKCVTVGRELAFWRECVRGAALVYVGTGMESVLGHMCVMVPKCELI